MIMGKAKKRHTRPYGFADHSHAATHREINKLVSQKQKKQLSYPPLFKVLLLLLHDCFTQNVMHSGKVGHGVTMFLRTLLCQFTQLGCGCVTERFHPGTRSQTFADSVVPARRCHVKERTNWVWCENLHHVNKDCTSSLRDFLIEIKWCFFYEIVPPGGLCL